MLLPLIPLWLVSAQGNILRKYKTQTACACGEPSTDYDLSDSTCTECSFGHHLGIVVTGPELRTAGGKLELVSQIKEERDAWVAHLTVAGEVERATYTPSLWYPLDPAEHMQWVQVCG